MPEVIYVGPAGEVEVDVPTAVGIRTVICTAGEPVDLPAGVAGRPPAGEDPGEGLLAQVDTWRPAPAKADRSKKE